MIRLLLLLVLGCVLRDLLAMFCLIHYTRKCGGLVDLVKNHHEAVVESTKETRLLRSAVQDAIRRFRRGIES